MKIFTSYYAMIPKILAKYPHAKLLSISNSTPIGSHTRYTHCVPRWDLVSAHKNGDIDDSQFKSEFTTQLDSHKEQLKSAFTRFDNIESIDGKAPLFLLCYEVPSKFCHRHIVADYIKSITEGKVVIEEFVG